MRQDLHKTLTTYFRDRVGERHVAEGRYCIARAGGARGGTDVTPETWISIVGKHEHLVMAMLIEQMYERELREACPKCGKTKLGTYEDQGWRVWCVVCCMHIYHGYSTLMEIQPKV